MPKNPTRRDLGRLAAAMAAEANVPIRHIDLKPLQQHLVEIGNLPENVLTDQDSYPLSDEVIAQAVKTLKDGPGASIISCRAAVRSVFWTTWRPSQPKLRAMATKSG